MFQIKLLPPYFGLNDHVAPARNQSPILDFRLKAKKESPVTLSPDPQPRSNPSETLVHQFLSEMRFKCEHPSN